jgi:MFS family permease
LFPSVGRDNRIVMLALLLWALGEGLWANLRPIYIEQLGATPSQVGLVLAIEGTARVAALIPGGWLSDRYGPRKLIIASWLMGPPAALIVALAPTWRWVIPGVALYGASFFVTPALSSYALMAVPRGIDDGNFERTLTTVLAAYSVGLIFSQPIGGLIADHYGIRSTYLISVVVTAASTAVIFKIRNITVPREAASGDWRALLRNRPFTILAAFSFMVMLSLTLGYFLAPNFLYDERGFSLSLIGLFASLFSIGTVTWNLTLGRLRPRWGIPTLLGMVWLAYLILLQSGAVPVVSFGYLLLGAQWTARSLMLAAVARRVRPAQRGLAFGISEVCVWTAMALSPRIAGTLYETRPALPFIASLVSIPLVAVGSIVLLRVLSRPVAQTAPAVEVSVWRET